MYVHQHVVIRMLRYLKTYIVFPADELYHSKLASQSQVTSSYDYIYYNADTKSIRSTFEQQLDQPMQGKEGGDGRYILVSVCVCTVE